MLKGLAIAGTALLTTVGGAVMLSSGTGCTTGPIDPSSVSATTVAGYSGDQLANAAIIMNTATSAGLGQQAQVIAVMAAITETNLQNTATGDRLGLFGMGDRWGDAAERLEPARAATLFYTALGAVPNWQKLAPGVAAQLATGTADPDRYTASLSAATEIVGTLTPSGGAGCAVSGDSQALAQELMDHHADGTFDANIEPLEQIQWIAEGRTVTNCGIDVRTLQIMVLAVRNFDRVGVSSINRLCTGDLAGGGTLPHVREGGGKSVDFYMLDGRNLTGADGLSLRLIGLLDPIVPTGARIGQADCRADQGIALALQNFTQFDDTCHHLHVDVADTDGALKVG